MAIIATPSRRRLAMAVLLAFAVAGAVIRQLAPNPSTLRDIGTLLLVLWLPAVGNLVAYLLRKIPRRAPALAGFAAASPFVPHLQATLQAVDVPAPMRAALASAGAQCLLLVGQQAFTARLAVPVAQALEGGQPQPIELLHPERALAQLPPGTEFHLLAGSTAVARGRVEHAPPQEPAQ